MLGPEQERERRHQKEMIKVHSLWKSAKEELTKALDELRHTKREADLAKRALDHVKVGPSASIPSSHLPLGAVHKKMQIHTWTHMWVHTLGIPLHEVVVCPFLPPLVIFDKLKIVRGFEGKIMKRAREEERGRESKGERKGEEERGRERERGMCVCKFV